jgi:FAD/FMN-containing dehydrogenase
VLAYEKGATMSSELSRRDFVKIVGSTGVILSAGALGVPACARGGRVARARRRVGAIDEAAFRKFAAGFHGSLLRPTDPEYESSRRIWNARFDRHPSLIARCADTADVQRTVDFARAEHLLVAVRGGGHSFAGHGVCDGGLVLDLSRMKALQIDRQQRVIGAGPGLLSSELDAATRETGLAMVLGGCGSVGIGGFTLGGGEGALSGKYGLSCDNLLSADVVLADGRLVSASSEKNADLFWGLRGGGGNFGVVTSFRFRAHPVTKVVAGQLVYDLTQAPAVLRAYRAFAPSAPDELTADFAVSRVERAPALVLSVVHAGDAASAAPVLRTLRSFAKGKADTIAPVSYHDYQLASPGPPAGFPTIARGGFLPHLSDEVIDAVIAVGAETPPAAEFEMNHLHGAVSRVPLAETAFPLRQPGFDCFAIAGWLNPGEHDAAVGWVQRFFDAVRAHARGAYVNVLNEDEGERVRASYGPQFARLAALKRKYDPENFFRFNPNILPAAS